MENLPVKVVGHCLITDDLGNILLNQSNAIHPINMSRTIGRILAHEDNCHIHRIAFGNGGTFYTTNDKNINVIRYKSPNDGYNDKKGWESTLYHETYSKIINEKNILDDVDNSYSNDNTTSKIGCTSLDKDRISQVIISCTLFENEPKSLYPLDYDHYKLNPETVFVFDELGLYTSGSPLKNTYGYQIANLYDVNNYSDTGLKPNTIYNFEISVNNEDFVKVYIDTSGLSSVPYYKLIELLTDSLYVHGVKVIFNDGSSIDNNLSYGNIKFESREYGSESIVNIKKLSEPSKDWLFYNLKGFISFDRPVLGDFKWYQNKPCQPEKECERLLTHLIFSPIIKTGNRKFNIKYTLTIYVNRTYDLPIIDIIKDQKLYNELDTPALDNLEKEIAKVEIIKSSAISEKTNYVLYNSIPTVSPLQKVLDNIKLLNPKIEEYKTFVTVNNMVNTVLLELINNEYNALKLIDLDSRLTYKDTSLDICKNLNQAFIDEKLKHGSKSDNVSKSLVLLITEILSKLSPICIISKDYYKFNDIPEKSEYDLKITEFDKKISDANDAIDVIEKQILDIQMAPDNLKTVESEIKIYDDSGIGVYNKVEKLSVDSNIIKFLNNVVNMESVWSIGGLTIGANLYKNEKKYKTVFDSAYKHKGNISIIVDHDKIIPNSHCNISLSCKVNEVFDNKLILYSSGEPAKDTNGYNAIKLYKVSLAKNTGLDVDRYYNLKLEIDGSVVSHVISTVGYSEVSYGNLLDILSRLGGFKISLANSLMVFESLSVGDNSSIKIVKDNDIDNLFNNLYDLESILPSVKGNSGFDYNRTGMVKNSAFKLLEFNIGNLNPKKNYTIEMMLIVPKPANNIEMVEYFISVPYNLSIETKLEINKKYSYKVILNGIEYLEEIITNGYDKIYWYNLVMILNRKLNHYGIVVKFNKGLIFSTVKSSDSQKIEIIDIDLLKGLGL